MKVYTEIKEKRLCVGDQQMALLKIKDAIQIKSIQIRVRLYDPLGKRNQLFFDSKIIFPHEELTIYLPFTIQEENVGLYRYDIRVWEDGILHLSETIEHDYFYVDKIEILDLKSTDNKNLIKLKNYSAEKVISYIYTSKENFISVELKSKEEKYFEIPIEALYFVYGSKKINIKKMLFNGNIYLKHYNLFWRIENESEIFVYDPKAEGKKRLLLKGFAKILWDCADGVTSIKLKPEELEYMDKIMSYGIIKKLD